PATPPPPPPPTLFPYTTLFRSARRRFPARDLGIGPRSEQRGLVMADTQQLGRVLGEVVSRNGHAQAVGDNTPQFLGLDAGVAAGDRKSTRLNSSHVKISYAVFC